MEKFLCMKSELVRTHRDWIKSVVDDMKDIKGALKSYRYLDEAIELANSTIEALGLTDRIDESQIIRTNSTGLIIFNPENVASRIADRNKAKMTREEKIALYKSEQQSMVN